MNFDVIALSLLTAAGWGATQPVTKLGLEEGGSPFQASLTIVTVGVILYWTAVLSRGHTPFDDPLWILGLFAFTGLLATAIARVISFTGTQRVGASVNSAGINTRPVWAILLAFFFLGEKLTLQIALGVGLIVVGLISIALSRGGDISGWRAIDLVFPIGAAMAFAIGNVTRRFALSTSSITTYEALAVNELIGLIGLIIYTGYFHSNDLSSFLHAPRRAYTYFAAAGIISAGALFTLFEALNRGRVVIVDPLSSPQPIFAILFTAIFLREVEKITSRIIIGGTLVVVGVVLITGPNVITT